MRKSTLMKVAVSLVAVAFIAGCATGAGGPDPKELITQGLGQFKAGMEAKDIEKVMEPLSSDFSHYEWGNKDQLKIFLEDVFSQGDLDDAEVTWDDVEITIEGDAATAYPVEMVAVFGSATMEFSFKKEADGVWRVVGMEIEGI
ncbi:MAG: hypothetical protein GY851_29600 [bacterium]|nr:hypothetical protein [bacterium]